MESVSFVAHEAALARAERHIRRLWLALIVVLAVLGLSNGIWFWMFMW